MHPLRARSIKSRPRGYTIVEVLTVVALLGVLLAIAIPSYQTYRDKVRTRQAATEITAMGTIIQGWQLDARAYPDSLGQVKVGTLVDPWGRNYVYYNIDANGRGGARKDRALNPINTDFDLYSLGPDGKSKPQVTQKDSVDDIIRANSGKFVGVAADF